MSPESSRQHGGGFVYVACSTLCFSKYPLTEALHIIGELGFTKFDVAIHENGTHLKPSEVAKDVSAAVAMLKSSTGLVPAAFSIQIEAPDTAEFESQFLAICQLARHTRVPLLCMDPATAGTPVSSEVHRLTQLVRIAERNGVQHTITTTIGTLTEDPTVAVDLCRRVPGLGLTLDPSHYVACHPPVKNYDMVYPYVRHVHLRDTGRGPNQFQVSVGQGEIEYGRVIAQLTRYQYNRILTVDIRDQVESRVPRESEVRKLKYLLESLV